jgi:hypothetical protein
MGQEGAIRYEEGKFQRDFSVARALRFMAEEGLGKPIAEADSQVQAMLKLLDENGLGDQIEIKNIVVFYNPRAELQVTAPPRPVANAKGLKKAIRKEQDAKFPRAVYRQLEELFDEVGDLTYEDDDDD